MLWWKVLLRSGDEIGYCGLFDINQKARKCEIGYGLLQNYWGRGYASELVNCLELPDVFWDK